MVLGLLDKNEMYQYFGDLACVFTASEVDTNRSDERYLFFEFGGPFHDGSPCPHIDLSNARQGS